MMEKIKCNKCKNEIPYDSDFCPCCGNKIEKRESGKFPDGIIIPFHNEIPNFDNLGVKTETKSSDDTTKINEIPITDNFKVKSDNFASNDSSQKKRKPIILIVLLLISIVANIFLFINAAPLQTEIETLKNENNKMTQKYDALKSNFDTVSETANQRLSKSNDYDSLKNALSAKIGYASENFHCDKPIIVCKSNVGMITVECYDKFNSQHQIQFKVVEGWNCDVKWQDSSWQNSCSLYITPRFTGITKIEISNSYNSQAYFIVVMVTD